MLQRLLLINSFVFVTTFSIAAAPDTLKFTPALQRLKIYGDSLLRGSDDAIRSAAQTDFSKLTDSILHTAGGMQLSFYQVPALSITASEDNNVRFYNWLLTLDQGNLFNFYGIAMTRPDKKTPYKLYRLQEKKYTDNEGTCLVKLDSSSWLGCIYYKIVKEHYKDKVSYVALGWAPQSLQTTRKIIEPLVITASKLTLGAPVIKAKGKKVRMRLIFEYNARATMSLRYDDKQNMIVFDHLAPSDQRPESRGVYSMYGPDLSYDGLTYEKGSWILKEDLELKNKDLNEGKEGKFFGK